MGRSEFDERDIHLALDGELPPEDAAAFQAWLEANPEMRMLRARYASDRALLHQALGEIAQEDPPARLKNGTRRSPPRAFGPSGTLLRFTAAAALLLVLGAAGGYFA
ncbi:anti-sigma factor, partial [Nitratireductor sp. ZSWI3]|uniref:anti-sigma factor family protein n=1 Tax=Nitratireductor sp. ZSWI3 TaxID=2966359 RepID=UPI0035AE6014|nr:anti-sigma factor [Nitratireductor sp. ZSWI3]